MTSTASEAVPRSIAADLAAGETVRWTGRPYPPISAVGELGSAIFGGLFLILPLLLLTIQDPFLAPGTLFLLLFVAVGLLFLTAPLRAFRKARRTHYVITDRRLLIARADNRDLVAVPLRRIGQVERSTWRDRTTLRIPMGLVSDGDDGQTVKYLDLDGVRDGDRAYRLLTGAER